LLLRFHPDETKLNLEALQWMALALTLVQFSYLAGFVSKLRSNVRKKNQELAAQNLQLEIALQRISDMAIRDELTGVYNRRYLMERIAEETQRSLRNGSAYSIGMIDIDFFKLVNDTYGHPAGDEVLRRVSVAASDALRLTDCFGRFGGEEFMMVLIDTPLEGAMITAERVRSAVEALDFPEIDASLRITISIGVAEHARRTESAATIKRADDSLYVAKKNGRNQCVAAALT
jgi:diguanylate cyclase (GGDEF)-like protein